jgi:hypothetical protein
MPDPRLREDALGDAEPTSAAPSTGHCRPRSPTRPGVHLAAGPRFGLDGTLERFLRLPFTLHEADLRECVLRLAAANRELDEHGTHWRAPSSVVA